jgi:hypothetical protein
MIPATEELLKKIKEGGVPIRSLTLEEFQQSIKGQYNGGLTDANRVSSNK